ncbi:MAG: 7-cyano-7-deazaguanine synthase QueC [Reyranella sp.]|uniref:7-cyano-7-deazaguanine synthase QueC n=1 Tax=Reyranella sp. TaxID=1929291 RepID=UPI0011FE7925|nr:7-cyano-7-deazaguanine synthase QueC [Reyranella sp.]TAJ40216.1 MAG: 7-cyano-7-deazaguanine synthase QueC [Reyranella sp.]
MAKRIVVLHSGGMDSTTCLYEAHAAGHEVTSLGFEYGQRLSVELLFAARQCERLGIRRDVVSLSWQKPNRPMPIGRAIEEMPKSVSPAFLPARNVVFLSVACAHAAGVSADEVHIGLNSIDYSGYPDCTPEFLKSFQSMMSLAHPGGPTIVAPLMSMSKAEIATLAKQHGLGEYDTWSCYRPQVANGGVVPCGNCDACRLHSHAWKTIK